MPLFGLIAQAYGVQGFQVYGAPSWVRSDTFDVVAKSEPGDDGRLLLRLQTLLERCCSLKVHREIKELPVLDLAIANSSLKLPSAG